MTYIDRKSASVSEFRELSLDETILVNGGGPLLAVLRGAYQVTVKAYELGEEIGREIYNATH